MCSVGDDNVETETEKYMPGIEKLNLFVYCIVLMLFNYLYNFLG